MGIRTASQRDKHLTLTLKEREKGFKIPFQDLKGPPWPSFEPHIHVHMNGLEILLKCKL